MSSEPPQLTRTHDGYNLVWESAEMEIRKIRRVDDDLRCELLIAMRNGTGNDLVHFGRLNLLAPSSRQSLMRSLKDRIDYVPWADMLEQMVFLVVKQERVGEPAIDLSQVDEPTELGWYILKWLLEDKPTTLFGMGGTGKTWLALLLGMCLITGKSFLGWPVRQKANVLFLDWENDQRTTRSRLGKVARGLGVDMPTYWYRRLDYPVADSEEMLARDIDKHDINVVILDSFSAASGGSQNKDEVIMPVYACLRRLGVATLLVDHESKMSSGEFAIGHSAKHNQARITWHMKATKEIGNDGEGYMLLSNRKQNEDALEKPFGIRIAFSKNAVAINRVSSDDMPSDIRGGIWLSDRILATLSNGKMETSAIIEDLDADAEQVRARLKDLKKRGKVLQFGGGKGRGNESSWSLAYEAFE